MDLAARRATKYFTGYLQKPQPLGKKELQEAAKQLVFFGEQNGATRQRHQTARDCGESCSWGPGVPVFGAAFDRRIYASWVCRRQ